MRSLKRVAKVCDSEEFAQNASRVLNLNAQALTCWASADYLGSTRTTVPSPEPLLNIPGVSASVSK